MSTLNIWKAIPLVVRVGVIGFVITLLGITPTSLIAELNLRSTPDTPWFVIVIPLYLWLFCKYLSGWGPPISTSLKRKRDFRANSIQAQSWFWSLIAGFLAAASMWILRILGETILKSAHTGIA
jgi:hypothetical protein